ncbi:MAG: transglycosylase SLT domain-containing protein [Bacteroidales bacterium]
MRKFIHIIFLIMLFGSSCKNKHPQQEMPDSKIRTWSEIRESGELHILTLYSSTSYFIYKGEEMGYEYELARSFAHSQKLKPVVKVATNIHQLTEMLKQGEGDLIAFPIPHSLDAIEEGVTHCGNENITSQVLIQRIEKKKSILKDVTELIGKEIYVEGDTKYEIRLRNLNEELGGGIRIHPIRKDSLTSEDLIRMVAEGSIDYTLADDNVARVNKTFHQNIDIKLQVSFPQRSSWIVSAEADSLPLIINQWMSNERKTPEYASLSKRYFEKSKYLDTPLVYLLKDGRLSVYDDFYRRYAKSLGWDWRLLAALSYEESRFDPTATSWAGARGLMQLMPSTGRNFGLTDEIFTDPEANIAAGVRYIASLQKGLSKIADSDEKINFVLGSFHAGLGHIYDAMELARKYGYDPYKWEKNVAVCLQLKSNPEYFNDSVVKCGYFPGNTTTDHVHEIKSRFEDFQRRIKK